MLENIIKIVYVVNVDWFFISHRLPLALEALSRKWNVYLICKNTGKFGELTNMGINCISVDFSRSGKNLVKELKYIFFLKKIYKNLNPDIIHHIAIKASVYGTIAAKKSKVNAKIINTVSGLGYTFTGNKRLFSKFFLIRLFKYVFSDQRTDFIFQNPDDNSFYNDLKFLNERNHVIIKGAGVDETVFLEKKNSVLKGKIRIVFLARMLKDKGVFEFIKAANMLRARYSDIIEFVLVGGIDIFNPSFVSEDQLISLTDSTYLIWLGHQENVKKIYESADIVCLPSYREGLPKSLVEAMAVGCPIITTDAIGCRECVDNGVNGFLVPVGDYEILAQRIEELVLDKELRIKMGHKSREKMIKEMSLSKVIKMTFDFYEQ